MTKERTAIVTGATSGIGLAVTKLLAERHRVFVCARTAENVTTLVKELREAGHQVDGMACDVRAVRSASSSSERSPGAWYGNSGSRPTRMT